MQKRLAELRLVCQSLRDIFRRFFETTNSSNNTSNICQPACLECSLRNPRFRVAEETHKRFPRNDRRRTMNLENFAIEGRSSRGPRARLPFVESRAATRRAERRKRADGSRLSVGDKFKIGFPLPPLSLSFFLLASSLAFRSGREVSLSDFVSSERGKRALSLLAGSRGPMLILFVYDYVCL